MIHIDGKGVEPSKILDHPAIHDACAQFRQRYGEEQIFFEPNSLYLFQGECGILRKGSKLRHIGSDDATTCVIVFFKLRDCTAVVHADSKACMLSCSTLIDELERHAKCEKDGSNLFFLSTPSLMCC